MSYIQYYNGIRYITSNNTNTNTEYYRDVFISNYRAPVSLNFPANHVVDDRRTKQPIHYSSSDVRFLSTVFPEKIHFLLLLFFLINSFIFTIRCGWLLYPRLDTLVFSPQSQKTFFFLLSFLIMTRSPESVALRGPQNRFSSLAFPHQSAEMQVHIHHIHITHKGTKIIKKKVHFFPVKSFSRNFREIHITLSL